MNWNNRKVLVTGAGGFIGSHLVERLVALGAETRAFVHYNALGKWGWLDESDVKNDIEVVLGDIRDPQTLQAAIKGTDVVFHLAALIGIPYSYRSPQSYVRTNVEGTLNVLQAALDANVGHVVHTSTSEVYGTAQQDKISEEHALRGQSPYAASKIGADKIAESFHLSFGLPVSTIRPFNTFGPRQSTRAVLPTIVTQALTGDFIELGNLESTRDFNYVSDTVEGFIAIAGSPNTIGEVINVGSGIDVSIKEAATMISRLVGRDLEIRTTDTRKRPQRSEVDRLCADTTKAAALVGWKSKVSLEVGLNNLIRSMKQHLGHHRSGAYAV